MACASAKPCSPEVAADTSKPRRSRKRFVTCRSFALSSIRTMRSRMISGCIELSLSQLNRTAEERVLNRRQTNEIDWPVKQVLKRELQIKVRVPTIGRFERFELHHKVDIAPFGIESPLHGGAENRKTLDAMSAAQLADVLEMIGNERWQWSHSRNCTVARRATLQPRHGR